eukprot:superscaffoldBa00000541_g5524
MALAPYRERGMRIFTYIDNWWIPAVPRLPRHDCMTVGGVCGANITADPTRETCSLNSSEKHHVAPSGPASGAPGTAANEKFPVLLCTALRCGTGESKCQVVPEPGLTSGGRFVAGTHSVMSGRGHHPLVSETMPPGLEVERVRLRGLGLLAAVVSTVQNTSALSTSRAYAICWQVFED